MRRLILAMTGPDEERELWLGWSLWRRAHQAIAKRCHSARRALEREGAPPSWPDARRVTSGAPGPRIVSLTDTGWERVASLLPPQKPPSGRPRRDHGTVLAGMLWVLGTGSSWRDLPQEEFGPWQTVYGRYRKWCREGLWRRIWEALQC